jgi:uncharacterized Fe-S cluster-containing radical SAM superfamily protein
VRWGDAVPLIRTDDLSLRLRERAVQPAEGRLLISKIAESAQAGDLSEPPNCAGFGRIRHFRYETRKPWPANPLPMAPAAQRLGRPVDEVSNAQVFQNAACNWRCWYCFVPFNLLAANERHSAWLTADDLVRLFTAEPDRPRVIDCSGGQPDLVPEWIPWMMQALRDAGLADEVYLWSDDNLSNDYFWRYLTIEQRATIASYSAYGRVCCFKGFDAQSFSFNTRADPELFDRQFDLFARLLTAGIDLYCYATFTSPVSDGIHRKMATFVDRLMSIHPRLPLRLVPLRIERYGVVVPRVGSEQQTALAVQEEAILAWNEQLSRHFTAQERRIPIPNISLSG